MKFVKPYFLLALLLVLSACAPKTKLSVELTNDIPQLVAVLPSVYPTGVQKERVDYVRRALEIELQNRGFLVLDDAIVTRFCPEPSCEDRKRLSDQYGVQGFVEISINSASRSDFVAGYYNAISGSLRVTNRDGTELATVKHTESERGGLIFNSGQVFQGVISQLENYDDKRSNFLADRFAKRLSDELPRPQLVSEQLHQGNVAVQSVTVSEIRPGVSRICAAATPTMLTTFSTRQFRSTLREVKPGEYCAILALDPRVISQSRPFVEVRSPYGAFAREEVQLAMRDSCEYSSRLRLDGVSGMKRVFFKCSESMPVPQTGAGTCDAGYQACSDHRLIVYRAPTVLGPFEKVGESSGPVWVDRSPAVSPAAVYSVVAVDSRGVQSIPVTVSSSEEAKSGA